MTDKKSLKVILDVSTLLNHGKSVGAGRYIFNLIKGLLSLDKENKYILFGTYSDDKYIPILDSLKEEFADADISFKFLKAGPKLLKIYETLKFPPLEFLGLRGDVLHAMDYIIAPSLNINVVLTVHDLAFVRFPRFNFRWFINKYRRMVKKNADTAKTILASSHTTASDLNMFFKIDMEKIEVIYLAVDPVFRQLASNEIDCGVLDSFDIKGPFFLSVGTIEPRKDFVTLIKAYNMAREKDPSFSHKLVIAGRTGWKSEMTYSEKDKSPYTDDIIFTGEITDRELVQLYNQADVFVYTSLFEGFGFPPLEAMTCGLPVIFSDCSSLSEVVGNVGMAVKPGDIEGFCEKMLEIAGDEKAREIYGRKSLSRAQEFSWKKTARRTLAAYMEAASGKK